MSRPVFRPVFRPLSDAMRLWIRVLCLLLLGHWWHATAMPYATHPGTLASATTHSAHHSAAHAHADLPDKTSAQSVDAPSCCGSIDGVQASDSPSQPTQTSHTSCGSAHVCCTLQPTPLVALLGLLSPHPNGALQALTPQWVLQDPPHRLFKPPRATLPL